MKLTWLSQAILGVALSTCLLSQGLAETVTALFTQLRQPAVRLNQNLLSSQQAVQLAAAQVDLSTVFIDAATQRFATLLPSVEMFDRQAITAVGNAEQVRWVEQGFMNWLVAHQDVLRINPAEITLSIGKVGADQYNIHGQREYRGIPVRRAGLTAVIKHGRLILFGLQNWSDISLSVLPTRSVDQVKEEVLLDANASNQDLTLNVRMVVHPRLFQTQVLPALAWEVRVKSPDGGVNQLLVLNDLDGQVLKVTDLNREATTLRNVNGGIYPFSNDGVDELGVEYDRYPMPYAYVQHDQGTSTTNIGGNVDGISGSMQTELKGPYVEIADDCGLLDESSLASELNLGVSSGTDCTTPLGASVGNTHAARNAFYHVNHAMAGARSILTSNSWLTQPLTVQVNAMTDQCNAIWNGDDIVTYLSSASCANFGELAGVLIHEFTHGLDENGTASGVTSPSEGITDAMAALKTNDSCPARGAFPGTQCPGFGDACQDCDGTIDVDWARHLSGIPHDLAWVDATCSMLDEYCRGVPVAEAVWDLYARDLQSQFGMDPLTARNLTTQLTLAAADVVGNWYQSGSGGGGGCNADGGYLNFLAADDDDGDLGNGTPHMQAIFNAFDRHGIACDTPAVTNSGCNNGPVTAPQLVFNTVQDTATVNIEWPALNGASSYVVYRGEGIRGCDSMMNLVTTTAIPNHQDVGLQIGRTYTYSVNGIGPGSSCHGPSSVCLEVSISDVLFEDGFD